MNYQVAFDASQNYSQLFIWGLGPIFASIFFLIGWVLRQSTEKFERKKGVFFTAVSSALLAGSLLFLFAAANDLRIAKTALRSGRVKIAEGTIENFVPMPPGGHATESFIVDGTPFSYGSGWGSITFDSDWNTGFIHNGVQVRIAYRNGEILRIEVK
jgi:hypothetical protein